MKKGVFVVFYFLFMLYFVSASAVGDNIPIQIQTVDASGNIITGTFEFKIDISNSVGCTPVLYSNTSTRTTDSRGIVSYNLENVNLSFDEQYWFCYYRDGVLKDTVKAARVPYTFRAKNVTLSGVEINSNLNLGGYNITASIGNFGVSGVSGYKLNVNGKVNITGDLYVNGVNITGLTGGSGVPVGMIAPFNQASCPTGWILADGTSGTPDLRGIFIRGAGTSGKLNMSNGTAFSATLGTYQNDSFQAWQAGMYGNPSLPTKVYYLYDSGEEYRNSGAGASDFGRVDANGSAQGVAYGVYPFSKGSSTGVPRTGAETNPAYYATIYCVKTAEDTPVSNTIWGTSGNIVLLNNQSMNFNVNNTLFVNSSSGRVGIGNGSARGIFDVGKDGNIYLVSNPMVGTAQFVYLPGRIYLAPLSSSDNSYIEALRPDGSGSLGIVIRTSNAGVQVNAMKIDSTGNVGIGTTVPSSKLEVAGNVTIRGSLNISGASRIRATRATAQTITGGSWIIIQYNIEGFDNLGEYDNATNYRFTAKEAGYYQVNWGALLSNTAWAVNDVWHTGLFKNNAATPTPYGYRVEVQVASTTYLSSIGSDIIYLAAGDYIDIRGYMVHSTSVALYSGSESYNYFSVHRLS